MTCVVVLAAGHPWESPALGHLEAGTAITVLKRCVDVEDLLATVTTGQADVAVVALDAPGLDPAAVEHLQRHGVRPVLVAPGEKVDLEAQELCRRLRVDAVLAETQLDRLADLVTTVEEPADHATPGEPSLPAPSSPHGHPAPVEAGRTVVVWGPAGAPGRTTVAVNLAVELARRQRPVVLADLDPHGGTVAQQLGILDAASGVLAAARLAASGHLPERFVTVCRGVGEHLAVVTGLPRADRWREVRPAHVDELLGEAAGRGDVVVDTGFGLEDDSLDLGRTPRHAMTFGALAAADEVVVVGAADPVGLARLARALVELHELGTTASVRVVVNRMRPTIGWSEREIAGMVEGFSRTADLHFLPEDRATVDQGLVTGRAAVELGDSALARGISSLADAVVPASVQPQQEPRGVIARIRQRTAGTSRRR